ncbi:MAG: T9SS type A sorting domain-containing protein [Flavobacteriales bacterium]|nr:T9SS type A sorting domain-containing protein [Flavobacteriales bacterium]
MRALYTLAASLLLLTAHAQWPTDPNDPLVVCNDPSDQRDYRLAGDGAGGWYVTWLDNRLGANRYAVFGQRVNSQGIPQWEPNGRLIQEVPGRSIGFYAIARMSDNNLFMAYISGVDVNSGDTVRAMAFDDEGAAVWAEPTLLAIPGMLPGGGTGYANFYPRLTPVLNGMFVGWGSWPVGGADYVHLARVLNDGTNLMPVQGIEVPNMNNSIFSGPWSMRHDLNGGLLLEERWGNGAGAPLYAMRVDSMGNQLWPSNLIVSANSGGLAYEWSSAVAPTARVNSVWANGYDLRMAIYDTTGVLFNTTAPIDVCIHPDVQENPFVVQSATETTVFWADNRAALGGGRQVFMQRFDAEGNALLPSEGALALQCNGNQNGFPRAIAAEDNTHIVAMIAPFANNGATPGFRVGRVTNTGTNLWSDTTRFTTTAFAPNDLVSYSLVSDGDGGAACFWFNSTNNAIYAARLDRNGRMGDFTSVAEHAQASFSLFPNPATDRITLRSRNGGPLGEVRIHAADGRLVKQFSVPQQDRLVIDLTDLPAGLYTLTAQHNAQRSATRLVKH